MIQLCMNSSWYYFQINLYLFLIVLFNLLIGLDEKAKKNLFDKLRNYFG